jgi:hypothetical protein
MSLQLHTLFKRWNRLERYKFIVVAGLGESRDGFSPLNLEPFSSTVAIASSKIDILMWLQPCYPCPARILNICTFQEEWPVGRINFLHVIVFQRASGEGYYCHNDPVVRSTGTRRHWEPPSEPVCRITCINNWWQLNLSTYCPLFDAGAVKQLTGVPHGELRQIALNADPMALAPAVFPRFQAWVLRARMAIVFGTRELWHNGRAWNSRKRIMLTGAWNSDSKKKKGEKKTQYAHTYFGVWTWQFGTEYCIH